MRRWLTHHRVALRDSLMRLRQAPVASFLAVAVVGITLALPGGLYLAVINLQRLASGWEGGGQISLFLKRDLTETAARALADAVRREPGVARVDYISREQALAEFKRHSGFGEALTLLERNPLPAVLVVHPAPAYDRPETMRNLAETLGRRAGVELASLDLEWVRRLQAILGLAERFVAILAGLLGLAVLFIVGNTVRLAVLSRREEIEIVKLVGGTDAFIRRPLLYAGLVQGLLGGLMAALLVGAGLLLLAGPAGELAALYGANLEIAGLGLTVLLLPGAGGLLGWIGSWLAAGRHLRAIEPK